MSIEVIHNSAENRYEAREDGELMGFADYRRTGGVVDIVHTEVDPAHGGKGVGGKLVQGTLDQLRAEGVRVQPSCPFVDSWISKHPDYEDLRA